MADKFNELLGENAVTKDTPVADIKEALLDAGYDADHIITQAHLSMENPKILKDLNITFGKTAVTPAPMPEARKSIMVEKAPEPKVEVKPKPKVQPKTIVKSEPPKQPLQSNYNFSGTVNTQPVKTDPKVTPNPLPKKAEPVKPLSRQEISASIEKIYKIKPTEQQLNIITNPNISAQEKMEQLGIIKKAKVGSKTITETKDPGFLEKIGMYLFDSDVPLAETSKIKEAADGNPTEDEAYVSSNKEVTKVQTPKPVVNTPVKKQVQNPAVVKTSQEDNNFIESIGFKKINDKVHKGKSYRNLNLGSYSRMVIDMSNGITVTYQPRNAKKDSRLDVDNAIAISDYLYDFDFTDNVYDVQANNQLENLKYRWKSKDYTNQPFVQVRESLGNNKYRVKVKAVKDLTQKDFDDNKIYRQGYAKLSDFDISADQKKIKLRTYPNSFVGQGLPYRDPKNQEHTLRIPGGKGNYNKYQNISELNQFGPYLGGTVTIISEDGKTVKKVSGSLKDILETAFYIKKQTGSKDVYFLQSDAGSMNIKADANNGKITKAQLAIARNQEPQAGAAEILLNE